MSKSSEASHEVGCLLDDIADPEVRTLAVAIRDTVIQMRPQQLLAPSLEENANDLIVECLRAYQEGACILARCINSKIT